MKAREQAVTFLEPPAVGRSAIRAVETEHRQGLADQILPAHMARRLAGAPPSCHPRYFPGEGHLSLIARKIGEVLAEMRYTRR